jgi:hypothetical protein
MPLLPLRWPPSGRKAENQEREFSQRGGYQLFGEQYARDKKYSLYLSSLLAGQGDPGGSLKRSERSRLTFGTVFW